MVQFPTFPWTRQHMLQVPEHEWQVACHQSDATVSVVVSAVFSVRVLRLESMNDFMSFCGRICARLSRPFGHDILQSMILVAEQHL